MLNSYSDRLRTMSNYRTLKPYEREANRVKAGSKHLLEEPTENGLQTALDKYKFHTMKSKGYNRK